MINQGFSTEAKVERLTVQLNAGVEHLWNSVEHALDVVKKSNVIPEVCLHRWVCIKCDFKSNPVDSLL